MKAKILKTAVCTAVIIFSLTACDFIDYQRAGSLMSSGDYAAALDIYTQLGEYNDSGEKIKECNYNIAKAMLESGDYENAGIKFTELGEYNDSGEKIKECNYNIAKTMLESGDYENAHSKFTELGDYMDSGDMAKESTYKQAVEMAENGNYKEAIGKFSYLGDYSDAKECLKNAKWDYILSKYPYSESPSPAFTDSFETLNRTLYLSATPGNDGLSVRYISASSSGLSTEYTMTINKGAYSATVNAVETSSILGAGAEDTATAVVDFSSYKRFGSELSWSTGRNYTTSTYGLYSSSLLGTHTNLLVATYNLDFDSLMYNLNNVLGELEPALSVKDIGFTSY